MAKEYEDKRIQEHLGMELNRSGYVVTSEDVDALDNILPPEPQDTQIKKRDKFSEYPLGEYGHQIVLGYVAGEYFEDRDENVQDVIGPDDVVVVEKEPGIAAEIYVHDPQTGEEYQLPDDVVSKTNRAQEDEILESLMFGEMLPVSMEVMSRISEERVREFKNNIETSARTAENDLLTRLHGGTRVERLGESPWEFR